MRKILFFSQFPWWEMGFFMPKTGSNWPHMAIPVPPARYFNGGIGFHRFLGHWTENIEKNWEKVKKSISHALLQAIMVTSNCGKIGPNTQFWCSLGPWWGIGICKVVSRCLLVFSRPLEGSKMTLTKKGHFSEGIYKVNEAPDGAIVCRP